MTPLYLQLGRNGDLLNLLPLLWKDAQAGPRPKLMLAAEYAPLLEGVSYVQPVLYPGPHYELAKAFALAQSLAAPGQPVLSLQVNGPADQVKTHTYQPADTAHVASSFQKEPWRLAGRLAEWDLGYPLLFDRRNPEREAKLLPNLKQPILVATGAHTSPFPYRDLLLHLLRTQFRNRPVVELPQAERLYDLLGLYERAWCLVAVDSAPLHLARACPDLPVIALTNDRPSLWNGSAWQPNWTWCCRYHDFPDRALEMLTAVATCRNPSRLPFIHLWNEYASSRKPSAFPRCFLPVLPGACGRDSVNTGLGPERIPYLKDCLRMGLQRAKPNEHVCLTRPDTRFDTPPPFDADALYACRLEKGGDFSPIVDLFSARKSWWTAHLAEIPNLLWGKDYFWSEALWALFKKHGAADATGLCWKTGASAPPAPGAPRADLDHNRNLCRAFVQSSKVYSRYPKVSEQIETLPLQRGQLFAHGYNCTLAEDAGCLLLCYRYHEGPALQTKLALARLTETGQVLSNTRLLVNGYSNDDPRFFRLANGDLLA